MESFIALFQLILENIWLYGASFLLVLTILVFVHEWGHFIVARMCGVKVEVFSIGFGKEIWGWTAKNGTRWKFSLIPLGGYVKMFGDADPTSAGHDGDKKYSAEEKSVAFFAQPIWKRSAIVFAGPAINFIFAIAILSGLFATMGKYETPPVVTAVQIGSAADLAGFKPHDVILEIDGREATRFGDIRRSVAIALDTKMTFVVDRNGQTIELYPTPERFSFEDKFGFKQEIGRIGVLGPSNGILIEGITSIDGKNTDPENVDETRVLLLKKIGIPFRIGLTGVTEEGEALLVDPRMNKNEAMADKEDPYYEALVLAEVVSQQYVEFSPIEAVGVATIETWRIVKDSLGALGQIVTGTRSAQELGGVIRIGAVAGDMAERGWIALITFAALLSINLGLINLFPIPLLDGGHLAMYAVEAVKGSPISEKAQEYAFRVGMTFLVFLMVFANLNDILQLVF